MMFEDGIETLQDEEISTGELVEVINKSIPSQSLMMENTIKQELSDVAAIALDDAEHLDLGQYRGKLSVKTVLDVVRQPSVMWLRLNLRWRMITINRRTTCKSTQCVHILQPILMVQAKSLRLQIQDWMTIMVILERVSLEIMMSLAMDRQLTDTQAMERM